MRIALLVGILFSFNVFAQAELDYKELVYYKENHDPLIIYLEDGRKLEVDFESIPWEEVNSWPAGKEINFGYTIGKGAILQDPVTGRTMNVLAGLEKHPLDLILDKCLKEDYSTQGMVECFANANSNWDQELNAKYNKLIAILNEDAKSAVRDSQRKWIIFRDAQIAAINSVYDLEGTMWRVGKMKRIMEVTKDQALRLNSLLTQ